MKANRFTAGVVAFILLAAVVFVPVPARGQWLKVLQDFGHAPAFGVIALAVLSVLPASQKSWHRYAIAFLVAVALGAVTELLQFVVARDPSWTDLRSDVVGAAAFLALAAAISRDAAGWLRALCFTAAIGLLAWHSLPTVRMLQAYERRDADFPVLVRIFDSRSVYFVAAQRSEIDIVAVPAAFRRDVSERALHVRFAQADWPGVDFYEPMPDWRGFRALVLEVVNPMPQPLELWMRIHDAHHDQQFSDRFTRQFHIAARSRQTLRIPLAEIENAPRGRRMDLAHIADFLLFRTPQSPSAEMYFVEARLER